MNTQQQLSESCIEAGQSTLHKVIVVFIFGVAFGYIESAVVVYLRAIFHPDGFTFPLIGFGIGPLWEKLLLVEIGREAATIALIFTSSLLFGKNRRQRIAYFMIIFAVWDIFYYVWLKMFLNWPLSIMEWDILFLIPTIWASPVLAPVLVSVLMLVFAGVILFFDRKGIGIRISFIDLVGFGLAVFIVIGSFCIGGLYFDKTDFAKHFHWSLFALGCIAAIVLFVKCILKSKQSPAEISH